MQDEISIALDAKFKALEDQLQDAQKNGASKDEVLKLHTAIEKQGTALEEYINGLNAKTTESLKTQVFGFIEENETKIKELYTKGSGRVEFVPKVVADMTTGSGANATAASHLLSDNLGGFNMRDDSSLLNLATRSKTGQPVYTYSELTPKDGDYAFTAEGDAKPQIDFNWVNRFATPVKSAGYEILTEESVQDVSRLQSVAETYLMQKHDLKKVNGIYFGTGTGANPLGATVASRVFIGTNMVDVFPAGTSNFMDVVNAIITDIYVVRNFAEEAPYKPNIVLINPIDFFVKLVGAKDGNGLPLYPQAGLFSQVRIGGITIMPWSEIPVGKIFVADMSKMHVVDYIPFSIRIGWIDNQLITNKFTMVGESRFYAYIKNLDLTSFVYDDIATVQAAITAA